MKRAAEDEVASEDSKHARAEEQPPAADAPAHAWTEDVCLICKTAPAPFPVLVATCRHPYCAACARLKTQKRCDLCLAEWDARTISFEVGSTLVVLRGVCGGMVAPNTAIMIIPASGSVMNTRARRLHRTPG